MSVGCGPHNNASVFSRLGIRGPRHLEIHEDPLPAHESRFPALFRIRILTPPTWQRLRPRGVGDVSRFYWMALNVLSSRWRYTRSAWYKWPSRDRWCGGEWRHWQALHVGEQRGQLDDRVPTRMLNLRWRWKGHVQAGSDVARSFCFLFSTELIRRVFEPTVWRGVRKPHVTGEGCGPTRQWKWRKREIWLLGRVCEAHFHVKDYSLPWKTFF